MKNQKNSKFLEKVTRNKSEYQSIFNLEIITEEHNVDKEKEQINIVRKRVEEKLKQSAANSLNGIKTERETKVQFKIELINQNQRPLEARSRPLPFHLKEKVKLAIKEQEDAGFIRKSTSEWTSALRIVHKPDGEIRLTVDYKPLNKIIKSDNYPIPNIAAIYKKLSKSKIFSKIDLKAAYHQIPIHKDSI